MAGIGGSYLSLYYPFNWSEGLSSGQGLMAVALGDLCPLAARWLPLGLPLMGRGGCVRAVLAIYRHHRRILHLQRNPLHHDLGGDDHHLFSHDARWWEYRMN